MRELTCQEIDQVAGAASWSQAAQGFSVAAAGMAVAGMWLGATPLGGSLLVGASVFQLTSAGISFGISMGWVNS